ncbi:MAG: hypothetical protein ACT4QG_22820 [Sporichthyaceae bacterium]
MTRGRHRQSLAVSLIAPVTLGAMVTAGLALALVNGTVAVLQMAIVASWVLALGLIANSARRGRRFQREITLSESMRRRDENLFSEQLSALQTSITGLQTQLERIGKDAATLRGEVVQLRAEKAEADEIVRRARAERARAALAEREALEQRMLTAAAFEAAAAVLASFENSLVEAEPDWVTTWIANLGNGGELDLTMHDDTMVIELEGAELPATRSA